MDTPDVIALVELRRLYQDLLSAETKGVKKTRAFAITLTKLDEAILWLDKHIKETRDAK